MEKERGPARRRIRVQAPVAIERTSGLFGSWFSRYTGVLRCTSMGGGVDTDRRGGGGVVCGVLGFSTDIRGLRQGEVRPGGS